MGCKFSNNENIWDYVLRFASVLPSARFTSRIQYCIHTEH